jgi:hypothetical protein
MIDIYLVSFVFFPVFLPFLFNFGEIVFHFSFVYKNQLAKVENLNEKTIKKHKVNGILYFVASFGKVLKSK